MARIELPPPEAVAAGQETCPSSPSKKSSISSPSLSSSEHEVISFSHSPSVISGSHVDLCSRCGTTAFYVQKDFDQRLGCAILALGAALALGVSWRFGGIWFVPVLLAFAAADLVLARRVPPVVICYQCDTEYRDVPDASSVRAYDPHIAERFAETKTVRRMNP
ncbi:MAG: hypothetical protein PT977_12500 [Acidobacteriota bacterium]|nr:hypothetical protein [Acidobacteriota bacterium]